MKSALPMYKRRIYEIKESQDWPTVPEVQNHHLFKEFVRKFKCPETCPYPYECIVVKMRCPPSYNTTLETLEIRQSSNLT